MLEAGIARVVIASDDPSEKAAGRGPGILRDGGVEVVFAAGAEAAAARLLNQAFRKHARIGLPLVTLKLAMSLDGCTSTAPGDSPWISGEPSRALVHRWRAEADAIAAGIGTVLADDPLLPARPPPCSAAPAAARRLRLPGPACRSTPSSSPPSTSPRSWSSPPRTPTPPASAPCATPAPRSSSPVAHPADRIASALADLGRRGITSLFLEGGRTLASAFASAGQINESRTFIAPMLLGAPTRVAAGGRAAAPCARPRLSEPVGEDTLITARYKEW